MSGNTFNVQGNSSSFISRQRKYKGLLVRPFRKNFRDDLFRFVDHVNTMSPIFTFPMKVLQAIISMQIISISLMPYLTSFWPKDSFLSHLVINIGGIISSIVPGGVSDFAFNIVELVIEVLILIILIIFIVEYYRFKHGLKSSSATTSFTSFVINGLLKYFTILLGVYFGKSITCIIFRSEIVLASIVLVFSVLYFIIFFLIQLYLISPNLSFRPQPFLSTFTFTTCIHYILSFFASAFQVIGSTIPGVTGKILCLVSSLFLLPIGLIFFFLPYVSANAIIHRSFVTMYFSAFLNSLIVSILYLAGIEGREFMVFVFIGCDILIYIFVHFYCKRVLNDIHKIMEEIEHNENYFETLSFVKAALVCKTSFEEGHPIAHRWVLFHKALDLFPKSKEIRILYARYAVIYPDEVGELEIACQELAKHKKHSIVIKHCLFQIHSILQQREVALSVSIKKSLSKLSKKVDKCRGQNRYIWECIIRGNLEELETLGARLKLLQENIERDYEQLRLIYPNNSYIAQGYFAYLKEFVRDQTRVAEMGYVYQRLRQGSRIMIEKRYVFASKYFPNIPNEEQHITLKNLLQKKESKHKLLEEKTHESSVKSSTSSSALGSSDSSNSNEITSSFMNESEEFLQYRYIESMVNSVQIPSMKYGPLIIALFIIIICGCIIGIFVFIFSEIGNITEVITIINKISELTFTISELPIFTYHAIYFNTNKTTMISLKDRWDIIYGTNKQIPDYWSTDTNAALQKVKEISSLLSDINTRIQSFSTNEHFQDAIDLLYSNILEMNIYTSHEDYTIENYSLQYMITYLMNIAITAVNTETPETILDDFEFWTMIKNIKNLIGYCESFEIKSINGIFDELESAKQQIYIFTLCLILLIYVAFISYIIYLIISLNSEKNMIYESFKSLPKSVISTIVNKLNKKKQNKEEDDNDINGSNSKVQSDLEDNAYRILSTSVNNESGFTGKFWRVLILIIIFSLCIICIVLLFLLQTSSAIERFKQIIPLYAEIPRTGLTFNQMLFNALRLSSESEFNGDESEWKLPKNAKENYQYITEDLRLILDNAVEIVNYLRLGSTDFQSQGLQIGGYDMISILTENPCVRDTYLITQDYQVFECTSYENVISYIWFQFIEEFALNEYNINSLSFADDKLNFMIVWLLGCSKDEYIIPIFEVLQVVSDSYSGSWTIVNMVIPIIVLTLIVIICCSILIPRFMSTANVACWILRLLLFCDPNVVLQSKPIMRIIMNNFTKNKDVNNLQETSNFYETVVSNLLDGVIFLTNTFDIISCNRSIENVIGKEPQSLIGKNINEIFTDPYGKDSSLSAFYLAISGISKSQRTPSLVIQIEVMNKQKEVTLELSLTAVSSNGYVLNKTTNIDSIAFFALLIKDMTMTIAQNKLLLEESIKSEKLLSMILPPLIVTKLQNGEKNISFSVKSASIMFVDIVSFTPWCGSHPAAYVMKTLNRLFLEFDRILKKYERMMKIKCIGDCYMCAGGIFDEINQPAEHTKQTISFGIDIIKAIQLLDIELNESLRIRVGVNTGGPIVAGVLGIEKPTFDILGSAICLAAMMEHHGVPMNVHIPQHCYDLVFGTIFRIKERGDVEVKGKMYHTYVVTGYE